jgi:hypothetical protein
MVTQDERKAITTELGIDDARAKDLFKIVINEISNHDSISDILKSFILSDCTTTEIIVMSYLVGVFNAKPEYYHDMYKCIKMEEMLQELLNKSR